MGNRRRGNRDALRTATGQRKDHGMPKKGETENFQGK